MPKYTNSYMEAPEEGDLTYSQEVAEQDAAKKQDHSQEDDSWKDRYGNLRRHAAQKEKELEDQLAAARRELDTAVKEQIKFPKTKEQIEAWGKKYPEVYDIVDTIAAMKVQEAVAKGDEVYGSDIRDLRQQLSRKDAETELRRRHPDFDELKTDEKFHTWLQEQPQGLQDTIYKNSTDAMSAARTIDFYKKDTGIFEASSPSKKQYSAKDAAGAVSTKGASPALSGKGKIKESDVARMSNRDYEKYEKDIQAAIAEGRFEYDISG